MLNVNSSVCSLINLFGNMGFLYARRISTSHSSFRILKDNPLHHDISKCNVCLNKWLQRKPKCIPQSGQDECCICLEVMAEIKGPDFSNCCKARLIDAFESHFIGVMEAGWLINE